MTATPAAATVTAAQAAAEAAAAAASLSTTLILEPPADPAASRAALPPDYDRRAWLLLGRLAGSGVLYVLAAATVMRGVVAVLGGRQLLVLAAASEAAFAVYYRRRYAVLNAQPPSRQQMAPPRHDGAAFFKRLLHVCRRFSHVLNPAAYLSAWFCGADAGLIRRDNLADFIATAFFYATREDMEAAGRGPLLWRCVAELEAVFGLCLPAGRTPGLRIMFPMFEPLRAGYRPLAFYALMEAAALLNCALLAAMGFRLGTDPRVAPGGAQVLLATAGLPRPATASRAVTTGGIVGGGTERKEKIQPQQRWGVARVVAAVAAACRVAAAGLTAQWECGSEDGAGASASAVCDEGPVIRTSGMGAAPGSATRSSSGGINSDLSSGGSGSSGAETDSSADSLDCNLSGSSSGGSDATTAPVLLLHGIGLGLLPYVNMLRCLRAAGVPVVAMEYKHVSQRLCSIIPSADEIAHAAVALMDSLGIEQACVVAQSYGTLVASRLAQLHPGRLQSLALLDPVCFGMFLPHLMANYFYRSPRKTSLLAWIEDVAVGFLSRDLHCAAAMCRRFYWSDLNLWPQDLPGRTLVAIGGQDKMLDVPAVLDFIRDYAAKVLHHPRHTHGQYLVDPAWQQQIVADIASMASAGGGSAGATEVHRRLTSFTTTVLAPPLAAPPPGSRRPALLRLFRSARAATGEDATAAAAAAAARRTFTAAGWEAAVTSAVAELAARGGDGSHGGAGGAFGGGRGVIGVDGGVGSVSRGRRGGGPGHLELVPEGSAAPLDTIDWSISAPVVSQRRAVCQDAAVAVSEVEVAALAVELRRQLYDRRSLDGRTGGGDGYDGGMGSGGGAAVAAAAAAAAPSAAAERGFGRVGAAATSATGPVKEGANGAAGGAGDAAVVAVAALPTVAVAKEAAGVGGIGVTHRAAVHRRLTATASLDMRARPDAAQLELMALASAGLNRAVALRGRGGGGSGGA